MVPGLTPPIGEEFFNSRPHLVCPSKPLTLSTPELDHSAFQKHIEDQKDVASCRLVCKRWNNLFRSRFFKTAWFHHPLDVDKFLSCFGEDVTILAFVTILRIDFTMPPPSRFTQGLGAPHYAAWPRGDNVAIHLHAARMNFMPRSMYDEDHPSFPVCYQLSILWNFANDPRGFQIRHQLFMTVVDRFPNVTTLDTGFSGTGHAIHCIPPKHFLSKFCHNREPGLLLKQYRGVWHQCDALLAQNIQHFQMLVELSLDLVCRPSNAPTTVAMKVELPALRFLTVAGYYNSPPLAWAAFWTLPSLEYLAVNCDDGDEVLK